MAKINEIQDLWEQDCIIDNNHLDDESIKTAKLHAKYINMLMETKLGISKRKIEISTLKRNKYRYYKGEMTRQELLDQGWDQWLYAKPLKYELEQLLEGDSDLVTMNLRLEYLEATLYLLESILKSIADRTWSIRNSISYKSFLAGV
jgi:hypothetical protein